MPASGVQSPDWAQMSWAERFAAADALPGQIQQTEQARQELQAQIAPLDQDIAALDQQIADLQARRAALQDEADDFWNRVLPDGLHWGFDDGILDAPWRTRSDTLEDQIAELDRQIAALQGSQAALVGQRQGYQQQLDSLNQQLTVLHQSQADLSQVMHTGIPMDGPSPIHPYFPGTVASNCTKYASLRRNVPCRGNAYQWNEQAKANGFEVGTRPVRGAVMVMEPGVRGADPTNGHVAIVERVERQADGSYKVWYTDNHHRDAQNPAQRTIIPGTENISFIYDKR